MATPPNEENIEFGVKVNWDDFKIDPMEAIRKVFADLTAAMKQSGATADQIFDHLRTKIAEFAQDGTLVGKHGTSLASLAPKEQRDVASVAKRAEAQLLRDRNQGKFSPPPTPQKDFVERWDEAAKAVGRFYISLWALQQPFRKVMGFVEHLRQMNLQFANLAQTANLTATSLAAQSGAFTALGSSAGEYANLRNSFITEMERRRIGLGNGGKFTQALMYYGVRYDPRNPGGYMRNLAEYMSSANHSDAQKLMLSQMLGLSAGMQAALRRGPEFMERYEADMKKRTANKTEAAKQSQELSLETEKLKASFSDLKDMLFTDLAPVFKRLAGIASSVVEAIKKIPPEVRYVVMAITGVVGALVSFMGVIKAFKLGGLMFRSLGALVNIGGGAAKAVKTATSVAPAVTNVISKGGLAALGPWGIAASVVDFLSGVTNTVMGGIQRYHMNVTLEKILALLTDRLPLRNLKVPPMLQAMPQATAAGAGNAVTVSNLSINVQSAEASATVVADEVHKVIIREFRVLALNGNGVVA